MKSTSSFPRSVGRRALAPPPSPALLALQAQGLEITDNLCSYSSSLRVSTLARSTPSDLFKPLPLEPTMDIRRNSSVYSDGSAATDPDITDIINLYQNATNIGSQPQPFTSSLHQLSAYQDNIAPFFQQLFNETRTNSTVQDPSLSDGDNTLSTSLLVIGQNEYQPPDSGSRGKPTFQNYVWDTDQKRDKLLAHDSLDSRILENRQRAYETLSTPSNKVIETPSFAFGYASPSTPISSTITNIFHPSLVPAPLDSRRETCRLEPSLESSESGRGLLDHSYTDAERRETETAATTDSTIFVKNARETWEFIIHQMKKKKKSDRLRRGDPKLGLDQIFKLERERVRDEVERRRSIHENVQRSPVQEGMAYLVRAFFQSGPTKTGTLLSSPQQERQKQSAIPLTPYQQIGTEAFSLKSKQKRQTDRRAQKEARTKESAASQPVHTSYRQISMLSTPPERPASHAPSNLTSIATALGDVKHKLTRSTSERRRDKLKQHIVLVGPTEITAARHATPD